MRDMTNLQTQGWVPAADSFGARLALVRWQLGWNQKEAALACAIPPGSWREWEEGRKPRGLDEIAAKISTRTGVSDYWLLTGKGDPSDPSDRPARDGVGPTGLEPMTSTVEYGRLAPVTPLFAEAA